MDGTLQMCSSGRLLLGLIIAATLSLSVILYFVARVDFTSFPVLVTVEEAGADIKGGEGLRLSGHKRTSANNSLGSYVTNSVRDLHGERLGPAARLQCLAGGSDLYKLRRERRRELVARECLFSDETAAVMDMQEDVPVVFVHRGYPEYLRLTQTVAAEFNRRVIVVLLEAAETAKPADPRVELINLNSKNGTHPWVERAYAFEKHYVHMSGNARSFELISFQRHFVLSELMNARGYDHVLYVDTDVMLLVNATQIMLCRPGCDMMVSTADVLGSKLSASPHSSYWSRKAITRFADFLWETYTVPEELEFWSTVWDNYRGSYEQRKQKVFGGICDMSLVAKFAMEMMRQPDSGIRPCNSQSPITSAGFFDHKNAHQVLREFHQDELGLPYTIFNNTTIPLWSIHFQNGAKSKLNQCYRVHLQQR